MARTLLGRAAAVAVLVAIFGLVGGRAAHYGPQPVEMAAAEGMNNRPEGWHETRFETGCQPGPFDTPPAAEDEAAAPESAPHRQPTIELPDTMRLRVDLDPEARRRPLLGAGFNLEHGLWSCPAFRPILGPELLEPFRPSLARVDTGLLPAAPPDLDASQLGPAVYQSVLASAPYAESWDMLRELDRAGIRILLGVWGGPGQFTADGTRLGELKPERYADYVRYVVAVVDFLVRQQHVPVWAITIANEPDGGDGNQLPPAGFAAVAHQLAEALAPYGVKLYGPDTTTAAHAMDYLPALLADPVVADRLAFVGFHQYFGSSAVGQVVDYVHARRPDLPVVVTEYTSFQYGDLDAGEEASSPLDFALDVADTVLAHYRYGADAALYWDAVDYLQPGHAAITKWGLLRGPADDFARRTRYYALRQVLPYLQPGTQVLETRRSGGDAVGALAVRTPDGRLAIMLVNQSDAPMDLVLDLSGSVGADLDVLDVTRTDQHHTAARVGRLAILDAEASLSLPPRSLTTLDGLLSATTI